MSLFPPECNWVYFSHTQNVSHHILSPSAMVSLSVVEGRPIPTRSPPELSTHFHAASHCSLQRPEWLRNGCTGAIQKDCSPPELLAAHDTQLDRAVWYDSDCANARAGGCRGGAAPLELSNLFECRSSLQVAKIRMAQKWLHRSSGVQGVQPLLNRSHHIRYKFNAGCSAGSAQFFVIRRITSYLLYSKQFQA